MFIHSHSDIYSPTSYSKDLQHLRQRNILKMVLAVYQCQFAIFQTKRHYWFTGISSKLLKPKDSIEVYDSLLLALLMHRLYGCRLSVTRLAVIRTKYLIYGDGVLKGPTNALTLLVKQQSEVWRHLPVWHGLYGSNVTSAHKQHKLGLWFTVQSSHGLTFLRLVKRSHNKRFPCFRWRHSKMKSGDKRQHPTFKLCPEV